MHVLRPCPIYFQVYLPASANIHSLDQSEMGSAVTHQLCCSTVARGGVWRAGWNLLSAGSCSVMHVYTGVRSLAARAAHARSAERNHVANMSYDAG